MIYKINLQRLRYLGYLGAFGLGFLQTIVFSGSRVLAQNIVPDNTLGNENSRVEVLNSGGSPVDRISGGAIRGKNLFHSFQEFNIDDGRTADFINPSNNIQNILTRVTGNNPSNIFGTLRVSNLAGVTSNPNFFLINPSGIVFGENASLDVPGSFVASTANGIEFGKQGFFSAAEPETPQLLTVNPSALFFNQVAAASIENKSRADAGKDPSNSFDTFGLRVPDGKSFLLVGGDINIDAGGIVAFGGRVDLSSIAGVGRVELKQDDNDNLSLRLPDTTSRGNITFTNGAEVIVSSGGGGGDIAIAGENVSVLGGSSLNAGILSQLGSVDAQAGDITLNATDSIKISDDSFIFNGVNPNAVGNSGDINIKAKQLNISEGGQVATFTFGEGDAGNITVSASESVKLNAGDTGSLTGLFAQVGQQGIGNAGNIFVEAEDLKISNGAIISTLTFGKGDAGNINVNASESVELTSNKEFRSVLSAEVASNGIGSSGDVIIETGSLRVTDGSRIFSRNLAEGNTDGINRDINIKANSVFVGNDSRIQSSNYSPNEAGDVIVETENFTVEKSQVAAYTFRSGEAGNLIIRADNFVELKGEEPPKENEVIGFPGGLYSQVDQLATGGKAGDIIIETKRLSVSDGSKIQAATLGVGDAGNIVITAEEIDLFNTPLFNLFTTGIFAGVERDGKKPNFAKGQSGNITINTNSLVMRDRAEIDVFSQGEGDAGSININARDIQLTNRSTISSGVRRGGVGKGGDISIQTRTLSLLSGSEINSIIFGEVIYGQVPVFFSAAKGDSGNLTIRASDKITISGVDKNGFSSGLLTITQRGTSGSAGDIFVETDNLQITEGGIIGASTSNDSDAGQISINTNKLELLNGGQIVTATRNNGNAGQIILNVTGDITLSGVDSNFGQRLEAANEYIINSPSQLLEEARDVIFNEGFASGIFANTASNSTGDGGFINLQGNSLSLNNGAQITAQNQGTSEAGNININLRDSLTAQNGEISTTSEQSSGGAIDIKAQNIRLFGDSDIRTNVNSGAAGGGNINLTANAIIALDDSDILSFARDGKGGDITFNTEGFFSSSQFLPSSPISNPDDLDLNDRVDVNASGTVSGNITGIPDTTFIQDSLTELPENQIDTNALISQTCVARSDDTDSTFNITGSSGFPHSPGNADISNYPTNQVRGIPKTTSRQWKKGDPIIEPDGVYRLADGRLALGRECR